MTKIKFENFKLEDLNLQIEEQTKTHRVKDVDYYTKHKDFMTYKQKFTNKDFIKTIKFLAAINKQKTVEIKTKTLEFDSFQIKEGDIDELFTEHTFNITTFNTQKNDVNVKIMHLDNYNEYYDSYNGIMKYIDLLTCNRYVNIYSPKVHSKIEMLNNNEIYHTIQKFRITGVFDETKLNKHFFNMYLHEKTKYKDFNFIKTYLYPSKIKPQMHPIIIELELNKNHTDLMRNIYFPYIETDLEFKNILIKHLEFMSDYFDYIDKYINVLIQQMKDTEGDLNYDIFINFVDFLKQENIYDSFISRLEELKEITLKYVENSDEEIISRLYDFYSNFYLQKDIDKSISDLIQNSITGKFDSFIASIFFPIGVRKLFVKTQTQTKGSNIINILFDDIPIIDIENFENSDMYMSNFINYLSKEVFNNSDTKVYQLNDFINRQYYINILKNNYKQLLYLLTTDTYKYLYVFTDFYTNYYTLREIADVIQNIINEIPDAINSLIKTLQKSNDGYNIVNLMYQEMVNIDKSKLLLNKLPINKVNNFYRLINLFNIPAILDIKSDAYRQEYKQEYKDKLISDTVSSYSIAKIFSTLYPGFGTHDISIYVYLDNLLTLNEKDAVYNYTSISLRIPDMYPLYKRLLGGQHIKFAGYSIFPLYFAKGEIEHIFTFNNKFAALVSQFISNLINRHKIYLMIDDAYKLKTPNVIEKHATEKPMLLITLDDKTYQNIFYKIINKILNRELDTKYVYTTNTDYNIKIINTKYKNIDDILFETGYNIKNIDIVKNILKDKNYLNLFDKQYYDHNLLLENHELDLENTLYIDIFNFTKEVYEKEKYLYNLSQIGIDNKNITHFIFQFINDYIPISVYHFTIDEDLNINTAISQYFGFYMYKLEILEKLIYLSEDLNPTKMQYIINFIYNLDKLSAFELDYHFIFINMDHIVNKHKEEDLLLTGKLLNMPYTIDNPTKIDLTYIKSDPIILYSTYDPHIHIDDFSLLNNF